MRAAADFDDATEKHPVTPGTLLPALDQLGFFFNDTATTEIYTLSLHDALPISSEKRMLGATPGGSRGEDFAVLGRPFAGAAIDRKSTRLNSSHDQISYAVF